MDKNQEKVLKEQHKQADEYIHDMLQQIINSPNYRQCDYEATDTIYRAFMHTMVDQQLKYYRSTDDQSEMFMSLFANLIGEFISQHIPCGHQKCALSYSAEITRDLIAKIYMFVLENFEDKRITKH